MKTIIVLSAFTILARGVNLLSSFDALLMLYDGFVDVGSSLERKLKALTDVIAIYRLTISFSEHVKSGFVGTFRRCNATNIPCLGILPVIPPKLSGLRYLSLIKLKGIPNESN